MNDSVGTRLWKIICWLLILDLAGVVLLAQPRSPRFEGLADAYHKSGAHTLRTFAPVVEAVSGSVVQFDRDGERSALGVVIDAGGLVLTKASEVSGGELTCRLSDGSEVPARVLATSSDNDIALVRVHADGLRPVTWSTVEPLVGQWAVTPGLRPEPEAVGIVSAGPRRIEHRRALIGVQLDLNSREARIAGLMAGLGAERAGMMAGDVVVRVNDIAVGNREDLVRALRDFREGQTVRLHVRRAEEWIEVEVAMMAARPDPALQALDRAERMNRMGSEPSGRADGFDEVLTHDTVLDAWQCGGPLLNLDGQAIGLNIARAGRVASYALPARLAREIADQLLSRAAAP